MLAISRRNRSFTSLLLTLALKKRSLILVLLAACIAIQSPCAAQPFWVNPSGGFYETGSNWIPNGIPAPGNTVTFGQPGPYDVSFLGDQTAGGLLITNNGDVSFTAEGMAGSPNRTFTVTGDATINNGVMTLKTPSNNKLNLAIDGDLIATDGDLNVLDGAIVQLGKMLLGDGEVVIDGVGPNGNPSTISATETTQLGRFGTSTVRVLNGAVLSTPGVQLGPFSAGSASVLLEGQDALGNPSRWDASVGLLVDQGNVTISGGALLTSGATSVSTGSIEVSDPDSSWITSRVVSNGIGNNSRIRVIQGGHVSSETVLLGSFGSNSGSIILGSSDPNALSTWTNSGDMFVGGSEIEARSDGLLELDENSRVEVAGTIKIWETGSVRLSTSSTLVADTILNNEGGEFDLNSGRMHVNRFEGDLVSPGGTLSPGPEAGTTIITGDYTQGMYATLAIDIGGSSPGGTHDLVSLGGNADLDGQLEISLIDGFVPAANDTFTVFAANSLIGVFDNISTGARLDTTDGRGSFMVSYGIGSAFDENRIILSDFITAPEQATPGDFDLDSEWGCDDINALVAEIVAGTNNTDFDMNGDGQVNVDDITDPATGWLTVAGANSLAVTGGNPFFAGDLDLDGSVGSIDLGLLLNNFGATSGIHYCGGDIDADSNVNSTDLGLLLNNFGSMSTSPIAVAAVPEPNSGFIVWCVAGVLAYSRRKRN